MDVDLRTHIDHVYTDDYLDYLKVEHYHTGFWDTGVYDGRLDDALDRYVIRLVEMAGFDETARILDLGCGPGATAAVVRRRVASVVGIDLSRAQLEWARRKGHGASADFLQMDAARLGFRSRAFDGVLAVESICHVPDKQALFQEILRALRPGGRLAFSDFVIEPGASRRHRWYVEQVSETTDLPSVADYVAWLDRAGLVDVRVLDLANNAAVPMATALRAKPYRSRLAAYTRAYLPGLSGRGAALLLGPLGRGWRNAFRHGHARQVLIIAHRPSTGA